MKHILVVDDDPTFQRSIGSTLTHGGYQVTVAKDGIDALVLLKGGTVPDLMVLDVVMPEINGYDVCQHIKFDPKLKHIPIIIMTSRGQDLDPRLAEIMGIDYLHKTCYPADLLAKVQKLLGASGPAQAS